MLAEIEVAHKLGVEVFVLDTGWYEATGDWRVSKERFPNGLGPLRTRLDEYGMKLGLWFGPTTAALSSNLYKSNERNRRSRHGKLAPTRRIWETEESAEFCLVSSYADEFAQELIRCAREFGVRYFKWDAVDQYGCDDSHHDHGNHSHTAEERADRYAFCQPLAMVKIVETLTAAYPDAIVDFDVDGIRPVLWSRFSVGRQVFPHQQRRITSTTMTCREPKTSLSATTACSFTPARQGTGSARTPYSFDRWIPSVLFLVHYLPDDPSGKPKYDGCVAYSRP